MKKLVCIFVCIFAILAGRVENAQAQGECYIFKAEDSRLHYYLLPGEAFSFHFSAEKSGYLENDNMVSKTMRGFKDFIILDSEMQCFSSPLNKLGTDVPKVLFDCFLISWPKDKSWREWYLFSANDSDREDSYSSNDEASTFFYKDENRFKYIWMSNGKYAWMSESERKKDWIIDQFFMVNLYAQGLKPNSSFYFFVAVNVIDSNRQPYHYFSEKTLIWMDGIRGDIDGDGNVGPNDVKVLLGCLNDHKARYNQTGLNSGKGIVLFHNPDLISSYLINVWIHSSSNPLVQGLGIGRPMSETTYSSGIAKPAGSTIVRNMPYDSKITGNLMTITTQGHAVNVTAILPDGKLWQETRWVENGEVSIQIPNPGLKYNIESTWIPGKADIQTSVSGSSPTAFATLANHPNPFNPSTTIDYSLAKAGNIAIEVYNIVGQRVATLVDGSMSAGKHSVIWNAKNLSAGIYFCILKSENKVLLTQKMTLLK